MVLSSAKTNKIELRQVFVFMKIVENTKSQVNTTINF